MSKRDASEILLLTQGEQPYEERLHSHFLENTELPFLLMGKCLAARGPILTLLMRSRYSTNSRRSPLLGEQGGKTLVAFTARDNPKVKDVNAKKIRADSIIK